MSNTQTAVKESRLKGLDAARGLAASAVVFAHVLEISDKPAFLNLSRFILPGIGGVFLFFLISGFVISYSLARVSTVKEFAISRCFRIYPLFLASLVIAYCMFKFGIIAWISPDSIELAALVNLTMIQEFVGFPSVMQLYWSLGFEVIFYFVMALMLLFGKRQWASRVVIVCIGLLLALVAVSLARDRSIGGDRLTMFTLMFLGVAFYAHRAKEMSSKMLAATSAAALVAISLQYYVSLTLNSTSNVGSSQIQTTIVAFGIFLAALHLRDEVVPKPLIVLGRISFSLYLVHGLILYFYEWSPLELSFPAAFLLVYTVSVALSYLTYELIEKPGINLGKRIAAGMRA